MLKIAILALDNCIHSSVTGPFDIFSVASLDIDGNTSKPSFCQTSIVLPGKDPVTTFNGLSITSQDTINDRNKYDIVIIPALFGDLESALKHQGIMLWLKDQYHQNACICTVCAGAFLAAEAGLLNGKKATTHWALADAFSERYPDIELHIERMLIDEGDIITAGGISAYLDLCLYITARFGSPALATFTLAASAGLGERTFSRRFKKATSHTPTEYIRIVRIEETKKLLETTNESIEQLTRQVGYEDVSSFRRLFKHKTGLSPSAYRRKFPAFH